MLFVAGGVVRSRECGQPVDGINGNGMKEKSMENVSIVCRITTKPGKRAAYVEALTEILQDVMGETGTLVYVIQESNADENVLHVYELYTDAAALEAHRAGEAFRRVVPGFGDLVAEPPELVPRTNRRREGVGVFDSVTCVTCADLR
jgi:quinol monooxygenase YgiN